MELDTSTLMLIFFVLFLTASIWKIWAFLPNEQLKDDDKTEASEEELISCILKVIQKTEGKLNEKELFVAIKDDESFDKKHFWRFNEYRLIQILRAYYVKYPDTQSISDIYHQQN